MDSLYVETDAAHLVDELKGRASEDLARRTYTARLLGRNPALVLHGGGNTSAKSTATTLLGETITVLYIKGSGADLATLGPDGHPAVRLEPLLQLRRLETLSDEQMVNALRLALLDAGARTPSVETLLHAFLPAKFIDHTHADAVLALADQPDPERLCRHVYGPSMVFVPYVMPGFALAKRCADAYEVAVSSGRTPHILILEKHGIFTLGETAEESYERMIAAVTRAERLVAHAAERAVPIAQGSVTAPAAAWEALALIRGALARAMGEPPERGPLLCRRASDFVLRFLAREDAEPLSQIGCATPDHVIRTKPLPLFVRAPDWGSPERLRARLEADIDAYARRYDAYFAQMTADKKVRKHKLDPFPRVVLLPGFGLCAAGRTLDEARIAADIYEHTMEVITGARAVGEYQPVAMADLFDLEYWSLEQAKLKPADPAPLASAVALVTGAGSGIGRATSALLLRERACVALVDHDSDALRAAREGLAGKLQGRALACCADVTSEDDVRRAVHETVAAFGGLDLVVSNAGSAPEGRLETESGARALERSLEVNLLAHNRVARAAVEVMARQGRGGCLLFNASKAAFNPGPGFGPYAVAKSALVALMRQYAIDLGPLGVRANAVNADRVRTGLFTEAVLESRAKARGLPVDEYFRANLLAREVTADDVAHAFVFLANARATTGCVVTVDGGNASAFPR